MSVLCMSVTGRLGAPFSAVACAISFYASFFLNLIQPEPSDSGLPVSPSPIYTESTCNFVTTVTMVPTTTEFYILAILACTAVCMYFLQMVLQCNAYTIIYHA